MANLNTHAHTHTPPTQNSPANNVGTPTNWKKKKKDFLLLHTDTHMLSTHTVYTMLLTHFPPPYDIFKLTSRNYV